MSITNVIDSIMNFSFFLPHILVGMLQWHLCDEPFLLGFPTNLKGLFWVFDYATRHLNLPHKRSQHKYGDPHFDYLGKMVILYTLANSDDSYGKQT